MIMRMYVALCVCQLSTASTRGLVLRHVGITVCPLFLNVVTRKMGIKITREA